MNAEVEIIVKRVERGRERQGMKEGEVVFCGSVNGGEDRAGE